MSTAHEVFALGEGEINPVTDNSTRHGRSPKRRVGILFSSNTVEPTTANKVNMPD